MNAVKFLIHPRLRTGDLHLTRPAVGAARSQSRTNRDARKPQISKAVRVAGTLAGTLAGIPGRRQPERAVVFVSAPSLSQPNAEVRQGATVMHPH
jgi:hypothetical protein